MPKHDVFLQDFHHSITNCLPFYWQGFSQSVRYTYIIEELDDLDTIWAGFRKTVRAHIRKAEQEIVVRAIDDVEPFIALNRMTYERQGMPMPYSAELIRRLDAACSARGVRRILLAEGADGTPHAAVYLVWDAESAYSLMSGNDPHLRSSGAISLLRWEAIKFARQVTRRFDFEGSMLQPVERFFRAFGGRQVRFARLARGATLKGQLALMAYEWSHARKRRSRASIADDVPRLARDHVAGPARPAPVASSGEPRCPRAQLRTGEVACALGGALRSERSEVVMSIRAGSIALILIAQIMALLVGGTPALALEET